MRSLLTSKKGQVQTIAPAILALVFASVVLIFGLIMLQELRDSEIVITASDNETFDAANKTIDGLATFGDFWEIIVLAIVISVVIGLLLVVFAGGRSR